MVLKTMASLSDLISSFLSSKLPSSITIAHSTLPTPPSISQPIIRSSPIPLPSFSISARQSQQLTTKFFTTDHDDIINRVAYPSLANANLMFFKSSNYNVEVMPEDDEPEEQLLNRFKRSVFRAGVLQESRRRRFFESSQEKRKRKAKEAAKKNRKRRPNPKPKPHSTLEIPKNININKEVEEEDNWEIPPDEIEIPYTKRFNS